MEAWFEDFDENGCPPLWKQMQYLYKQSTRQVFNEGFLVFYFDLPVSGLLHGYIEAFRLCDVYCTYTIREDLFDDEESEFRLELKFADLWRVWFGAELPRPAPIARSKSKRFPPWRQA